MARLAVTVAVIFFFFTISYASRSLDLPETDLIDRDVSYTKPTLLLPSENFEIDALLTTANTKPLVVDTFASTEILPESETETITVDSLRYNRPSTLDSFRPVNRHFRPKQQLHPGVARSLCRHGARAMERRFRNREVPYGNDMLMAGESGDFDPAMFRSGMRQNPPTLVRFHHHHHHHDDHDNGVPRFSFKHDMFRKEKFKRPFHFHREDEDVEEVEKEERGKGNEREEKEVAGSSFAFMKGIRKFLNNF